MNRCCWGGPAARVGRFCCGLGRLLAPSVADGWAGQGTQSRASRRCGLHFQRIAGGQRLTDDTRGLDWNLHLVGLTASWKLNPQPGGPPARRVPAPRRRGSRCRATAVPAPDRQRAAGPLPHEPRFRRPSTTCKTSTGPVDVEAANAGRQEAGCRACKFRF